MQRTLQHAASALCHNATLFDLYFAHSTSFLFKPTTMAAVGECFVGGQHRSIAVRTPAGSSKPMVISSSVDGRSVAQPVGWRELALF